MGKDDSAERSQVLGKKIRTKGPGKWGENLPGFWES